MIHRHILECGFRKSRETGAFYDFSNSFSRNHTTERRVKSGDLFTTLLWRNTQCPLKPCKDASLAYIAFDAAELRGLLIAKAEAGASTLPLH
jgi:hypothetical protein